MTRSKGQNDREGKNRGKRGKNSRGGRKEYYQKISQKKSINRWSEQEYLKLVALVRDYGESWDKISEHFINKTAKQCMQKFKNSARSAKKGNWTEEEDSILMDWIQSHGPNKWTECSKNIRGRCGKQCRERWVNILNPGVKKGNWTEEEQKLIFENLKRFFTSWSLMAKELEGRTENSIKNYFYSSVRRLKSNNIINYLRAVYSDPEEDLELDGVPDYPLKLKQKLGLLLQNREKMLAEISKLNCLSRMICEFMLDFKQLEEILTHEKSPSNWINTYNEVNQDFLRFLIEIVLQLNSSASKMRGGHKRKGGMRKGKDSLNLILENRGGRKAKSRSRVSKKIQNSRTCNKIMNSNIVNNSREPHILNQNFSSSLLPRCQKTLGDPNLPELSKEQIEHELFGDFKIKFFEANLDKIISWEELKSIAVAIGKRDWGYVKYILTIICLMLKSYQNISETNQHSKENNLICEEKGVVGVISKMKEMKITPDNDKSKKNFKELSQEDVQNQLNSLNNIFKKMKNIEVQMNISNCWNCHNKFCSLHPFDLTPNSEFKKIHLNKENLIQNDQKLPRL